MNNGFKFNGSCWVHVHMLKIFAPHCASQMNIIILNILISRPEFKSILRNTLKDTRTFFSVPVVFLFYIMLQNLHFMLFLLHLLSLYGCYLGQVSPVRETGSQWDFQFK